MGDLLAIIIGVVVAWWILKKKRSRADSGNIVTNQEKQKVNTNDIAGYGDEESIQKKFREGLSLWQKKQYIEAHDIFEKVAEQTMDPEAIRYAVMSNVAIAEIAKDTFKQYGIQDEKGYAVVSRTLHINDAKKWLERIRENAKLMAELEDFVSEYSRKCAAFSGQMSYLLNLDDCEDNLIKAINLGDNQSRMYLGLRYKEMATAAFEKAMEEFNKANADNEMIRHLLDEQEKYNKTMVLCFEEYIRLYNPEEAESDEYKLACGILAQYYSFEDNTEKDLEKARRYQLLADNFNEETKKSDASLYTN